MRLPFTFIKVLSLSLLLFCSCKPPAKKLTLVFDLQSDHPVPIAGAVKDGDNITPLEFTSPTNFTLAGVNLAVHLEMKTNAICQVTWYEKQWETDGTLRLFEKIPGATLDNRKNHFHVAYEDGKFKSGASEDETPPWKFTRKH